MSIRDMLNKQPAIAAGAIAALLAGAAFVYWQTSGDDAGLMATRAFYTVDDGKTYFVDSAERIYPFDYKGQQAYRANVFRCGSEEPFVGYISRFSERARQRIDELKPKAASDPEAAAALADLMSSGIEVKRAKNPTDKWVPMLSADAISVTAAPSCSQPGVVAMGVMP